ncbi:MAG: LysM peptidoglycan-binding domain-containing protein [Planctomycetes bacterium]|nr:LysM peptidoglycan-binding domain-containing protein [Planctomycetota bacterium]
MKRDARIGLAVVLVLGLSITLLVARAIHKRAADLDANEPATASADQPATDTARESAAQPAAAENPRDAGTQIQQHELDRFRESQNPAAQPQPAPSNLTPAAGNRNGPGAEIVDVPAANGGMVKPNGPAPVANERPNAGDMPAPNGAPVAPEAAQEPQTYTVAAGDNPYKISAKVFGDGKYAKKIMAANPSVDANHLKVGQKLKIPAIPGVAAIPAVRSSESSPAVAERTAPAPAAGSAKTYTVKSGDTLAAIAKEMLGSAGPKTIQKILDANPGVDAKKLHVGATLKIPTVTQ